MDLSKKIFLVILAVILVVIVYTNIPRFLTFNPLSEDVVLARENAMDELIAELEKSNIETRWTIRGSSWSDKCHSSVKGYYKRSFFGPYIKPEGILSYDFTLIWSPRDTCNILVSKIYSFDGDFKEEIMKFVDIAVSQGWEYSDGSRKDQITPFFRDYYDKYYGSENPKPLNFPDEYLVSDLPGSIIKNRALWKGNDFDLGFVASERATGDRDGLGRTEAYQIGFVTHNESNLIDAEEVYEDAIKEHQYVVEINIAKRYYKAQSCPIKSYLGLSCEQ